MNRTSVPKDSESLLHYLMTANMRSARTLEVLRALCTDQMTADEALAWLMDNGYVCADENVFELTSVGLDMARQVQLQVQGVRRSPANHAQLTRDRLTLPPTPGVDTHPLRMSADPSHHAVVANPQMLHFVLAFAAPKNALPIPVLDGDVLGRLNDVDISLRHDEYLSGQHCRFRVAIENQQPTLYVEDLGSRNGTCVNDARLERGQMVELKHGDRIHLGSTLLIVVRIPY